MEVTRRDRIAIGVILLLALALRVHQLNAPLWYDEVLTLTKFVRLPWPELVSDFSSLNNHMAYSIEAKVAIAVFGESAWAMRLPAVLFGVASIALLWPLAHRGAGRGPTLAAMLLAAISYHHIWFSQNARGYTELLFFTSLATLLLVRALATNAWRPWLFYGVSLALAMYTHLSSGFFFAAHGVVGAYLLFRREGGGRMVGGALFGAVLTLILYAPVIPQVLPAMSQVSDGKTSSTMAEWTNPLRMFDEVGASFGRLGSVAPLLLVAGLVVIVVGAARFWRREPVIAAIYVLSIPLALAMLVAVSFRIWPRYFFVDINMIFLFAALGCRTVADWLGTVVGIRWATPLFGAALAAMVAVSLVLLPKNYRQPKQDFAGAVAYYDAHAGPGDTLAAVSLAEEPLKSYFAPMAAPVRTLNDLRRLRGKFTTVWVMTAFDNHVETGQDQLLSVIMASADAIEEFDGTLGGGEVRLFRIPGSAGGETDTRTACTQQTGGHCGD